MGCGCGGSTRVATVAEHLARQREANERPAQEGPKAPGYTWDGPEQATPAAKPAEKPAA